MNYGKSREKTIKTIPKMSFCWETILKKKNPQILNLVAPVRFRKFFLFVSVTKCMGFFHHPKQRPLLNPQMAIHWVLLLFSPLATDGRKPRAFIHIGPHKTGSTSIQSAIVNISSLVKAFLFLLFVSVFFFLIIPPLLPSSFPPPTGLTTRNENSPLSKYKRVSALGTSDNEG